MVIRPSNQDPLHRTPAPGMDAMSAPPTAPRERAAEGAPSPVPGRPADRAEVSSAARSLFESALQPAIGGSTLSPERMRGILERVRTGHYDQPAVLDRIAQSIQDEVAGGTGA